MFKRVEVDEMASLLFLDRRLEPNPEPFRLQPKLTLSIDFDDYVNFVLMYLGTTDCLATKSIVLRDLAIRYKDGDVDAEKLLVKAFAADMAGAIGKELSFARELNSGATRILGQFPGKIEVDMEIIDILGSSMLRTRTLFDFQKRMSDKYFPLAVTDANVLRCDYMLMCYYLKLHNQPNTPVYNIKL